MKTLIISLGGSIIVPDEIDVKFLKRFSRLILHYTKSIGRVVIVAGGGETNRKYNEAAQKIARVSNNDLDWIGIAVTKLNAELLRAIFGKAAYERVAVNPTQKLKTDKKIIIASGWLPGCSSDKDAVLWAKNFGAKVVVNLSNIGYIYNKDPNRFKNVKPLKFLRWSEYKKIVGSKWMPRMHAPFDPIASRLAEKWRIEVIVMRGTNLNNFKRFLEGKKFKGSVINLVPCEKFT